MSITQPTITPPVTVGLPTPVLPKDWNLAQLQSHLGDIPLERIRMYPPPGMATEQDLLALGNRERVLCELIDGVLVEKTVGFYESQLALLVGCLLLNFLDGNRLGAVLGPDGPVRLFDDQIRMPDVSFIRRERMPKGDPARGPAVLPVAPDLAVEVLSRSNTRREMDRKRAEYFQAGVKIVWYIDPAARNATVFTSVDESIVVEESGTLDGGEVLPGLKLSLTELFARADEQEKMLYGED